MILVIDSHEQDSTQIIIYKDNCQSQPTSTKGSRAENLLSLLEEALRDSDASLEDIRAIAVHEGPGSYTSLRVGITTANTLAWTLDIPIVSFNGDDYETAANKAREIANNNHQFTKPALPKYPS